MVFNRNIKGAASAAAGCNSVISTGLPGDPPPTPNLDTLYPDMTREIFSNLPLADIGRCARVCRSLRIRRLSVKQQSSTPPPLPVPQLPPRQIERSYPPVSLVDSCVLKRGAFRSVYGKGKWFLDDEIITVHGIVGQEEIKDGQTGPSRRPIYAKKSENGKYVIQQQAIRGCTAATAAMLIKDHGGNPNAFQLTRRNLGNYRGRNA